MYSVIPIPLDTAGSREIRMTGDYLNSDLVAQNKTGSTVKNAPPKPDRDMAFRNGGGKPVPGAWPRRSQRRIVRSELLLARVWPSGLKATLQIKSVCP